MTFLYFYLSTFQIAMFDVNYKVSQLSAQTMQAAVNGREPSKTLRLDFHVNIQDCLFTDSRSMKRLLIYCLSTL